MRSFVRSCWAACLSLTVLCFVADSRAGLPPQIPAVASFTPSSGSSFVLSPTTRIIVDSKYGSSGYPSALRFAETFRDDLSSVTSVPFFPLVDLAHEATGSKLSPVIYIDIDPSLEYELFNGKPTDEGYDIVIEPYTIQIKASAPIGAWRGMTTLVQQAALASSSSGHVSFPVGHAKDTPGWEIRGFMLDAGRHWYTPQFIGERQGSFFYAFDNVN